MKPKLTAQQKAEIPAWLLKGAEAYGFRGDVWTANRVAEVIDRRFGVRYHRDHVGRLLCEAPEPSDTSLLSKARLLHSL